MRNAEPPPALMRLIAKLVARLGEPFRFGWNPDQLASWMHNHGFIVLEDEDIGVAGRRLLPRRHARWTGRTDRRLAVVKPFPLAPAHARHASSAALIR